jgi:glutathione reductase (NADPH)
MKKKNISLKMSTNVLSIEKQGESLHVAFDNGTSDVFDQVLYATGRVPRIEGLWSNVDITLKRSGAIEVNQHYETSVSNIYAVGDVIGHMQLTPVALAEGMAVAWNLFKAQNSAEFKTVDYHMIPSAIFSQPNYACVGLTEEAAKAEYPRLEIYTSQFTHLKHTISLNQEKTFMKLIVNSDNQQVLGAHMIGDEAGEIIQGLAVAIKAGATKQDFDHTIGIHPTAAEEFVTMRTVSREISSS